MAGQGEAAQETERQLPELERREAVQGRGAARGRRCGERGRSVAAGDALAEEHGRLETGIVAGAGGGRRRRRGGGVQAEELPQVALLVGWHHHDDLRRGG